jgi:hypothetical protein
MGGWLTNLAEDQPDSLKKSPRIVRPQVLPDGIPGGDDVRPYARDRGMSSEDIDRGSARLAQMSQEQRKILGTAGRRPFDNTELLKDIELDYYDDWHQIEPDKRSEHLAEVLRNRLKASGIEDALRLELIRNGHSASAISEGLGNLIQKQQVAIEKMWRSPEMVRAGAMIVERRRRMERDKINEPQRKRDEELEKLDSQELWMTHELNKTEINKRSKGEKLQKQKIDIAKILGYTEDSAGNRGLIQESLDAEKRFVDADFHLGDILRSPFTRISGAESRKQTEIDWMNTLKERNLKLSEKWAEKNLKQLIDEQKEILGEDGKPSQEKLRSFLESRGLPNKDAFIGDLIGRYPVDSNKPLHRWVRGSGSGANMLGAVRVSDNELMKQAQRLYWTRHEYLKEPEVAEAIRRYIPDSDKQETELLDMGTRAEELKKSLDLIKTRKNQIKEESRLWYADQEAKNPPEKRLAEIMSQYDRAKKALEELRASGGDLNKDGTITSEEQTFFEKSQKIYEYILEGGKKLIESIKKDQKLDDLKQQIKDAEAGGADPGTIRMLHDLFMKTLKAETMSKGGVVYANNGMLIPYQPKGTDTVPAMLTPGEFVVNRAATQKNLPLLKSINNGNYQSMGGMVYLAGGGTVTLPNDVTVEMTPQEARKKRGKEKAQQAKKEREQKQQQAKEDRETKETDRLDKWAKMIVEKDALSKISEIDPYKIRALRKVDQNIFTDRVLGVNALGLLSARELTKGTTSGLVLSNITKLDDKTLTQLLLFGEQFITLPSYAQTSQQAKDHLLSKGYDFGDDVESPLIFPDIDAASFKEAMVTKGLDENNPQEMFDQLLRQGSILGAYASNIIDIIEQKLIQQGGDGQLDTEMLYKFKSGGVDPKNLHKLLSLSKRHGDGNLFLLKFGLINEELAQVLAAYEDDISRLDVLGLDQMYKTLGVLVGTKISGLSLPFTELPINNPDLKGPSVVQLLSQFGGTLILDDLRKISTAQLKVFEQAGTNIIPDLTTLLANAVPPVNKQYGGLIYASEGTLVNYQPRGTDTVPAMLTPGEFVVNRAATQRNLPLLKAINSGNYENGGIVYLKTGGVNPRAVVPTTPINEDDDPNNPITFDKMLQQGEEARRGTRSRQDRQQRKEQYKTQKERLQNIFKLPPIGKLLINEIMLSPNNFDLINTNAINETLTSDDIKNKITKKLDDIDDTDKQKEYFVNTARSYLNRYRLLLGWYANSKKIKASLSDNMLNLGLNKYIDTTKNDTLDDLLDLQITNAPLEGMTIYNTLRELIRSNANLPGFRESPMNPTELDAMIGVGSNPVMLLSKGGSVYANQGMLIPYQPKGTDTVPAMLTPGEFVVNRQATQANLPLLKAINGGAPTPYSNGGIVYLSRGNRGPVQNASAIAPKYNNGPNFDNISRQLQVFNAILTGSGQILNQFANTLQQKKVNLQRNNQNNGGGVINIDGISKFTTAFNNFVKALSKINIPSTINIQMQPLPPIQIVISGAEALSSIEPGLQRSIAAQINAALNKFADNFDGLNPNV